MVAPISTTTTFAPGPPQRLFESVDLLGGVQSNQHDVFPDGQRFLTIAPVQSEDGDVVPATIRIVENWYEEFRDREQ